jgi:hypothetical protein
MNWHWKPVHTTIASPINKKSDLNGITIVSLKNMHHSYIKNWFGIASNKPRVKK